MKLELTVVGVQPEYEKRCYGRTLKKDDILKPEAIEGFRRFIDSLKIGEIVRLSVMPEGGKFPGSINVYDSKRQVLGSIAHFERMYIKNSIPDFGLEVPISDKSFENSCFHVTVEVDDHSIEPIKKKIVPEKGESVIDIMQCDVEAQLCANQTADSLHAYSLLEIIKPDDINKICTIFNEYYTCSFNSLDCDSAYKRLFILSYLKILREHSPKIDDCYNKLYKQNKSVTRYELDIKCSIYKKQYERIREYAYSKRDGELSFIENYENSLKFQYAKELNKEIIEECITNLSKLILAELDGMCIDVDNNPEIFAREIYFAAYDLSSLYILYSRYIKREYLIHKLEDLQKGNKKGEINSKSSNNTLTNKKSEQTKIHLKPLHFFNEKLFNTDDQKMELIVTLLPIIEKVKVRQYWYAVLRGAQSVIEGEDKLGRKYKVLADKQSDVSMFEDLCILIPELKENTTIFPIDDTKPEAILSVKFKALRKSVSDERKRWTVRGKGELLVTEWEKTEYIPSNEETMTGLRINNKEEKYSHMLEIGKDVMKALELLLNKYIQS